MHTPSWRGALQWLDDNLHRPQLCTAIVDSLTFNGAIAVPTPPASKVWNQYNTGTGTFIGGDVHGGMTFNYGRATDGGR